MQRRSLLQLGFAGTALLALVGDGVVWWQPGLARGHFRPAAKSVFRGVARALLDGSLPEGNPAREAALQAHLQRLDNTVAALPPATQEELSRVLALLAWPPGRVGLTGLRRDWDEADIDEIQQALQGLRTSRLQMRQQIYHALRDLTNAAYYADPQTWPLMGYPGPMPLTTA